MREPHPRRKAILGLLAALIAVGLVVSQTRSGPTDPDVAAAEEILEELKELYESGPVTLCGDTRFAAFEWHVSDGQIVITDLYPHIDAFEQILASRFRAAGLPQDLIASPVEELLMTCHPAGI